MIKILQIGLRIVASQGTMLTCFSFVQNVNNLLLGNKTLLKYSYHNNPPKNTQDGHYSEIIYAELDSTITKTNLKNEDLKKVKLHFGRLCFCKGATGYYPISIGEFSIKKNFVLGNSPNTI